MAYLKESNYNRKRNKELLKKYLKQAKSENNNRYEEYKKFLNSKKALKISNQNKIGINEAVGEFKEIWN